MSFAEAPAGRAREAGPDAGGASAAERAAMRRAIELAAYGRGATSPNPVVGCVVLDAAGRTVGEGYHRRAGGSHAEVVALREAGERGRGGTLVVTLEPCAHTGRTPPCVAAILDAGISRVIVAVPDPNPVACGGSERLREAGVSVATGVLREPAERVNEAWLVATRLRRPFVTWKFAASLDGIAAAADGTSQWITGEAARLDVHRLRAECDAIIVGHGTVRADNPRLTARPPESALLRQPLRVVLDTEATLPAGAAVFDGATPTLHAVAADATTTTAPEGVRTLPLPRGPRGLDLPTLLRALHEREVVSALLEGGPTLAGAFLTAGLVDRVVGYLAPMLLGGDGLAVLRSAGVATLAGHIPLTIEEVTNVDSDIKIVARVRRRES